MDITGISWLQEGVVSRAQALQTMTVGALRWKLARGHWRTIHPGVYLTHNGELTWDARTWAALLYCGPEASLSLESAAFLHGIERQQPLHVHVDVPHYLHPERLNGVLIRRRRRLPVVRRRSRPVTSAACTVLDVADQWHCDRIDAVALAARAVQRKAVKIDALAEELSLRRAHRHRLALELAMGVVAEGAESGLEVTYLDKVVRRHGLPPMRLAVAERLGGSSIRRDFENSEYAVVAEVDGALGHEGDGRRRDARRDRKTLATGRVTARQTWVEVHYEPCELAADLFGIYRSRGYPGSVALCSPDCQVMRHVALLSASTECGFA